MHTLKGYRYETSGIETVWDVKKVTYLYLKYSKREGGAPLA